MINRDRDRPRRLAQRQEQRSTTVYGGRQVPRSGSGDSKGDIQTDDELIECKHTERLSYGLMLRTFMQLAQQALLIHRRPVLEIEYTSPRGCRPEYLVVLHRNDYLAMRDELREARRLLAEMVAERQRDL